MRIPGFRFRAMAAGACAATLTLTLAACGSDPEDESEATDSASVASTAASRYTTPLKGICPDTVVIQATWWPEVSQGYAYQLLGPDPTIDKSKNRVTGTLGDTGVMLEIRSGGPAVGFQPVSSLLFQDDDILLGGVDRDEGIRNSANQPTVAVFAPYDKTPLAYMWGDPAWEFTSVADIGRSGASVLVPRSGSGNVATNTFVREGLLNASQVDSSYQGGPDRFVDADGKIVQGVFVTDEPYRLEHDVEAWKKPVEVLPISDEYPVYEDALSIRADKLAANRACLTKLVPLFQQAQRNYISDPGPTNKVILDTVETLDTGGFTLSPGLMADANAKQRDLELIADGSDGVLGSFDTTRIQELIGRLVPVFEGQGAAPKPGLAPADLVTNDFLDTSISLD